MAATQPFAPNQLHDGPLAHLRADHNQTRHYPAPATFEKQAASIVQQKVIDPIVFRTETGVCRTAAGQWRYIAVGKLATPHVLVHHPLNQPNRGSALLVVM